MRLVSTVNNVSEVAAVEMATVSVRLEGDDLRLFLALVQAERLSQSDVLRRALRAYGSQLGIGPDDYKKPKPKPKR